MMQWRSFGVPFLIAAALAACAPTDDELAASDDTDGLETLAIRDGVTVSNPSVIGIRKNPTDNPGEAGCSATAITPRHLLTSAHCVPANSTTCGVTPAMSARCSYLNLTVFQALPDGSTQTTELGFVQSYQHEDWSGESDTPNDIALIALNADLPGVAPTYLSTNIPIKGDRLEVPAAWGTRIDGWQAGGPLQSAPPGNRSFAVDWTGPTFFEDHNDQDVRLCEGDSGSPAFKVLTTLPWYPYAVSGVAMGAQRRQYDRCVKNKGKQRWTAVAPKIGWIQRRLRVSLAPCPSNTPDACCVAEGDAAIRCF